MARVSIAGSFCASFAGDVTELDMAADNLLQLIRALDTRFPGLGAFIEAEAAIAVDGILMTDWTTALGPDAQVMLVPRIAGGQV